MPHQKFLQLFGDIINLVSCLYKQQHPNKKRGAKRRRQEKEKQENKLDTLSFLYNAQAEPYCLKLINKQGAHSMYTVISR